MQNLGMVAQAFEACVVLDQGGREEFLSSMRDPRLTSWLRTLLKADDAARREGFLSRMAR